MKIKKVLVFLAKAFELMEFSAFVDMLGWARHDYGHNLVFDNNIITSHCPETAPNVAFELLKIGRRDESHKKSNGFLRCFLLAQNCPSF